MSVCDPQADNVFGPRVVSCRGDFDFTLLFEQALLSMVPSAVVIIVSVGYTFHLFRQNVKTKSNATWLLRAGKQVR
jgi:ATP-binding cassette, subfamily C (CFTR/MRP), member 1